MAQMGTLGLRGAVGADVPGLVVEECRCKSGSVYPGNYLQSTVLIACIPSAELQITYLSSC